MKKQIVLGLVSFFMLTTIVSAQSESYKPWQVNITGGYAIPSGKATKAGITFNIEPQFNYTDNLSFGFRLGSALTLKAALDASGQEIGEFSVAAVGSYVATGSYYFQSEPGASFRPFAGVGLGFATAAGASVDYADPNYAEDYTSKSGFAGLLRAGFDISHFRLNAEYNVNPKTGRLNNNFIAINLGFYFGGGANR